MKNDIKILMLLLLIIVVLLFSVVYEMKNEGTKCLLNPLTYGVSTYSNNNQEMICTCTLNIPDSPIFYVTKDKIEINKGVLKDYGI